MDALERTIRHSIANLFVRSNGSTSEGDRDLSSQESKRVMLPDYDMNKDAVLSLSLVFRDKLYNALRILETDSICVYGEHADLLELVVVEQSGNEKTVIVDLSRRFCSCKEFMSELFNESSQECSRVYCRHLLAVEIAVEHRDKLALRPVLPLLSRAEYLQKSVYSI